MLSNGLPDAIALETQAVRTSRTRVRSIDVLRGIVVVLMAVDHVRVYSGVPPGGPDAAVFFTRWITHFCAPAFAFFAGTSAFLYGIRINNKARLTRFLITRGIMLVVLELTLIRFSWTFNLNYSEFVLAGVIWMLGWCMILLSAFVWMRPIAAGLLGASIIFLQRLFAFVPRAVPEGFREDFARIWEVVYPSGFQTIEGFSVLYSIAPWIGVMAAGYGFGAVLGMEPTRRAKICIAIGASLVVFYLVAGTIMILNTPDESPFVFRLLNQAKYPASPLFLAMTLGPVILLVPYAEKWKGNTAEKLSVFGKVPFFYYLLHIPLIHLSAVAVNVMATGSPHHEWYAYAPYATVPEELRWSLPLLYLVFAIDVILLYFACKWYAAHKEKHPGRFWMKLI